MRLFVAVMTPPEAREHLGAALAGARVTETGLRWVDPSRWHLTLAFLGAVAEGARADLDARLARAAHRHRPIRLQLSGCGHFGDRILYADLAGDRQALTRLAGSCAAAARRTGIAMEERPFRPHLTLARSGGGSQLGPLAMSLETYAGPTWLALEVQLIGSRPPAAAGTPPEYVELARWPLRPTR